MEGDYSVVVSPRPVPVFDQDGSFIQRKRTPFRSLRPPKAPAKSCPPVSRISRTPAWCATNEPRLVSFKSEKKPNSIVRSPYYNSQSHRSYFEQCFKICEKLGEGSFGEVFRVRSRDNGKMYAVKKSHQHFRGAKDRRLKLAEVERHEDLPPHPNCVQFHQAWEEKQKLYIQTELCKMSLTEYADQHGPISEQRVWHVLVDLVKGLKHLHDHRLCHLDIKPANIFLGEDDLTCKLGDFGLCTSIDQGFMDAMEGDSKYLAPELMNHQFGKEADIFSLGISVLELACDVELPSGGENWHLLRCGQLPPQLVKDLSPGLVNLLSRMMHPDPNQRPSVDEILADPCVLLANTSPRVVLEGYQLECSNLCWRLLHTCRHMLTGLVAVFSLLLTFFSMKKWSEVKDVSHCAADSNGRGGGGGGVCGGRKEMAPHDESFISDDDDVHDVHVLHSNSAHARISEDIGDQQSTFNQSWIRHSPVRYPSPVYAGPPIPLDFGDSSFDSSPDRPKHSSPAKPKVFSGSRSSFLNVEPKNLMEAFKDT